MTRKIDKNFLTQKQIKKMKTIKQQVEVSFHAVEIGDAVKLLPIMDAMSAALDILYSRKTIEVRMSQ